MRSAWGARPGAVGGGAGGERTMVGVLVAQRERLRARVAQLEEAAAQVRLPRVQLGVTGFAVRAIHLSTTSRGDGVRWYHVMVLQSTR